jgi:serine/threonine-protein kinase
MGATYDALLERFEDAWSRGERPALQDYLPAVEPDRCTVLVELVRIDLELRLQAGEARRVESYLADFPELATDTPALLKLLRWEYRLRRRCEPGLTAAEYVRRFPHLGADLAACLRETAPARPGPDTPVGDPDRTPRPAGGLEEGGSASPSGPRYQGLQLHAEGGLGAVYRARDTVLHRDVALKRIKPRYQGHADSRRRFLREAEVTGRLEHPGIVPVHDLQYDPDGQPGYVMRFVEGQTLRQAVEQYHAAPGRLAFRQLLQHFIAACNAVAYAHSRGVLHRDLKPANVMLGPFGETLVVDWGLARVAGTTAATRTDAEGTLTTADEQTGDGTAMGQALGTPAYMSPEQAAGRWNVVGPASDVYGLGATLYHLLTGQAPFQGADVPEVLGQVQRGAFVAPRQARRDVPRALDAVCQKAMALEPAQRYATATELAQEVERWLADEPVRAYREPWPARLARWGRRHPALTAGAVALLGTAVAALAIGLGAVDRERTRTVAAKERAEENFRLADSAVDRYLNAVTEDRQLKEKDFFALRKKLLEAAVPFYEQLAQAQADDPKQEAARGLAYHRLAHVRRQLGEPEAARADHEQTRAIFAQLAAAFPAVPDYRHELARNCHDLGVVLARLGNRPEEEAAYRQALALEEQLVADFPAVPDYRHDLAKHCTALGNLLVEVGRQPEAERALRRALSLLEQLAADFPTMPEYRQTLAVSHLNLGVLLAHLGKPAEAATMLRRARLLQEQLVADFPSVPQYRRELAGSHNNLGILLYGLGKRAEAEAEFRQALALLERLAAEFASVPDYAVELGSGYGNFGKLVCDGGQAAASLDWFARASATLRRVLEREPRLATARLALRNVYWGRANALTQLDRHAEAVGDWEQAVALNDETAHDGGLRLQRFLSLARAGQYPPATAAVEDLLRPGTADSNLLYNAACVYAVAAAQAAKDAPAHTSSLRAEQHARRAVVLLRQAVQQGYNNVAHLKQDADLDGLRPRPDFQQLLAELEAKAPGR